MQEMQSSEGNWLNKFNGYIVTLMVIFYFQVNKKLPSIRSLQAASADREQCGGVLINVFFLQFECIFHFHFIHICLQKIMFHSASQRMWLFVKIAYVTFCLVSSNFIKISNTIEKSSVHSKVMKLHMISEIAMKRT